MNVLINGVEYVPAVNAPVVTENSSVLSILSTPVQEGLDIRSFMRDMLLSTLKEEHRLMLANAVWAADPNFQKGTDRGYQAASALVTGLVHAMCDEYGSSAQASLNLDFAAADSASGETRPLKPGTVISYNGMEAKVLDDAGGPFLTVCTDEVSSTSWYWTMGGVSCRVVSVPD